MTWHGFVDESRRGGVYLMAVTLVRPRELDRTRVGLRRLVKPGQRRVHFKKESDSRRRELVSRLHDLGLRARVWSCRHHDDLVARRACLAAIARKMLELGVSRLALESCQHQDIGDRHTLAEIVGTNSKLLTYDHLRPGEDPILWVSDGVAWCHGAGGDWRRRVGCLVDEVTQVDVP
ncbi:hypothetical protein F0L68_06915 [Solihabitans fulvus]|uniref:DUF3800 domain-containing protein n=1 Tax=Solihabitans fulvus TaxID=1892852 RepID=A0A5B2XPC1_9PSEU|nr:hypothetical protein [Solihabitans fulvus]KAA2264804.1 hypothetical protein F0L68_06915 [Solihabitans fulvus]